MRSTWRRNLEITDNLIRETAAQPRLCGRANVRTASGYAMPQVFRWQGIEVNINMPNGAFTGPAA
jgi:hypothetical protein